MRNEEFEIVRDLIAGRGPHVAGSSYGTQTVTPASFREIDGLELARQYVAHRKFRESEALAQRLESGEALPDSVRTGILRGEHRSDPASEHALSSSWLSSWARILWRR